MLLSWLGFLRRAVIRKASGLTDERARRRPEGWLISLAGLVHHLSRVEWRWIDGGFLGADVERAESEFTPGPPIADLLVLYGDRARRTDELTRRTELSVSC